MFGCSARTGTKSFSALFCSLVASPEPGSREMADFIASWEPGWEVDLASRRPGSTSCSGNQTKRVCIPLAWPVQKQTTNQTLKLQTGRGRRRASPATSPEILRPVRFLSPGSRACRLGTRVALPVLIRGVVASLGRSRHGESSRCLAVAARTSRRHVRSLQHDAWLFTAVERCCPDDPG